jgi:hypothetical protein
MPSEWIIPAVAICSPFLIFIFMLMGSIFVMFCLMSSPCRVKAVSTEPDTVDR